jgi:polyphosphate kinase 2
MLLGQMTRNHPYRADLRKLQIALVRHQKWAMKSGAKALVIFEGRDGAGKDGTIRRIIEHLAPRNTRVAALPKPSDRQRSEWYFQRYVPHLPAGGDFVIFNRSWYNRAGVERVMGFCTQRELEDFLRDVPAFERMLEESDIRLIKIWLDISKHEQATRLDERRSDPLKLLKVSDLDGVAQKKWKAYSQARDDMLSRTHTGIAPWICVRADHKKAARLNVIRHLLHTLAPAELLDGIELPDPKVLFPFEQAALDDGRLAK